MPYLILEQDNGEISSKESSNMSIETLQRASSSGEIISDDFIRHILSPGIKRAVTVSGKIIKTIHGCYFIDEQLVEKGILQYGIIDDGFPTRVRMFCEGASAERTVWPIGWTKKDVIANMGQAINNSAKIAIEQGRDDFKKIAQEIKITGEDGIVSVLALDKNNKFITCYPVKQSLDVSSYRVKAFSGISMKTLAWFLLYDVGDGFSHWIKGWVVNSDEDSTGINSTSIDKFGDKIFIASDIYDDFAEFELSERSFLNFVNSWNELREQGPKEIVITKEGDNVTVEGRN